MPGPALGLASGTPFVVPGEHFAAALVFFVAGVLGLVWVAPELAAGRFLLPRVVAVAHLFTLGWITTSIMGAMYQLLPVALGIPVRWIRLAHIAFGLYVPGLAMFVVGLVTGVFPLLGVGAVLFALGILVFLSNLFGTLFRAKDRDTTWWALAGAGFFLLVTLVLGLSLAGNLHWGYLGAHRLLALAVHLHVAVVGWVLLVIVGIARKLLPMFLLSHGAKEGPVRWAAILIASGAGFLTALHHAPPLFAFGGAYLLAGAGVIALIVQVRRWFKGRHRPQLDPGLRLVATALGYLVVALALAPVLVIRGATLPWLAATYGTALVIAGLSLFVAGHYYKILPFLVWNRSFAALIGKRKVPMVADLYSRRLAWIAVSMLAVGAAALVLGVGLRSGIGARLGAVVLAMGGSLEVGQMFAVFRRRAE